MANVSVRDSEMSSPKTANTNPEIRERVLSAEKSFDRISHEAGQKIGGMAVDVGEATREYVEAGKTYVKEHPVKSVAYAVAAGAVAGTLVTLFANRKH